MNGQNTPGDGDIQKSIISSKYKMVSFVTCKSHNNAMHSMQSWKRQYLTQYVCTQKAG